MENIKFFELIKYIAIKSLHDKYFGRTKLNKILFFCDFLAYRNLGNSITGEFYHKEPQGPVPNRIKKVMKQMIQAGSMREIPTEIASYTQYKPVALENPDLSLFQPEEISLIDGVLEQLRKSTATDVSDLSHSYLGWEMAEMGAPLPYEVALVQSNEPTDEDIEHADRLAELAETSLKSL